MIWPGLLAGCYTIEHPCYVLVCMKTFEVVTEKFRLANLVYLVKSSVVMTVVFLERPRRFEWVVFRKSVSYKLKLV